jgi:hypothetical protein
VRHVRMLGLCLVAMAALGAVLASSSLAAIKETDTRWSIFKNCPTSETAEVEGLKVTKCSFGATAPNAGGFYSVGPITVPVTKQIVLQGGLTEELCGGIEGFEETCAAYIVPPEDGASAIVPVAEKVPGEPLASVTEAEMEEFGWPQELRESYKLAQKHHWFKEGKTTEVIEPAGADQDVLSVVDLEVSEGTAILANVQITGKNKWLEELGGNCQIGSEADPVVQHLTTGPSVSPLTGEVMEGKPGYVTLVHQFEMANLTETQLVDNTYSVPGAEKCGGSANEAYLDPVVNRAFGLPAPAGASKTELDGALWTATTGSVRRHGF